MEYIDVNRATHTNLDVKQERRIDEYWNIDGSRDLSDSWTGVPGVRLTKRQATSRPDHLWPEIWRSVSRNSKMKERKNCAIEKQIWRTPEEFEVFTSLNVRMKDLKRSSKTHGKKAGSASSSGYAL